MAIASLIVMPMLIVLKHRFGKAIGSRSLVADSKETLACLMLSVALLIGLGTFYIWRLWWIDSVACPSWCCRWWGSLSCCAALVRPANWRRSWSI